MKKIAILGAGISGLSLAWFLEQSISEQNNQFSVTIYEKSPDIGGWIKTKRVENALFECGPRSLRTLGSGRETIKLIEALGLKDEVIFSHENAKYRYIAKNNALVALPSSIGSLLFSSHLKNCSKALLKDVLTPKSSSEDQSVYDFFSYRFGKAFTNTYINPLCAGIWAASPELLSVKSTFLPFFERAIRYRSALIGQLFSQKKTVPDWVKGSIISFKGGAEVLPRTLCQKLRANIVCNTEVHEVLEKNNSVTLRTSKGVESFDFVVSTVTPDISSKLFSYDNQLVSQLKQIEMTSVVTVSLAFELPQSLKKGFGFLCSDFQERELLGIVFDSEVFQEHNGRFSVRLSVMMGGTKAPYMIDLSDDQLRKCARFYVRKYLKLYDRPTFSFVFKAKNAISLYKVGHEKIVQEVQKMQKARRIHFAGSAFSGASIGDCITFSKETSKIVAKKVDTF